MFINFFGILKAVSHRSVMRLLGLEVNSVFELFRSKGCNGVFLGGDFRGNKTCDKG